VIGAALIAAATAAPLETLHDIEAVAIQWTPTRPPASGEGYALTLAPGGGVVAVTLRNDGEAPVSLDWGRATYAVGGGAARPVALGGATQPSAEARLFSTAPPGSEARESAWGERGAPMLLTSQIGGGQTLSLSLPVLDGDGETTVHIAAWSVAADQALLIDGYRANKLVKRHRRYSGGGIALLALGAVVGGGNAVAYTQGASRDEAWLLSAVSLAAGGGALYVAGRQRTEYEAIAARFEAERAAP